MTNTYQVWKNGNWETVTEGQRFFIGHSGSGTTVFGEHATLTRATNTQLVFTTDSGQTVKTGIDDLRTKGKLSKQGWFVSLNTRNEGEYLVSKVIAY